MTRPTLHPVLAQIRNPTSEAELIIALKALKNDIIGHQQRKEIWVGLGVIESLVSFMTPKVHGKTSGADRLQIKTASKPLTCEEVVRLQALCIVGSLAHGGPAFLSPLHSASSLPAILSNICPLDNPPEIVLAGLRAISSITDSISLISGAQPLDVSLMADILFSRPYIDYISQILAQISHDLLVQSQISLTASLISRLCRDDQHQLFLANAGVLDALATILARVVVSQGLVIPGADAAAQNEGIMDCLPPPAPQSTDFANVLEAIAIIIGDSNFRASQLLYSGSVLTVFPSSPLIEFPLNKSTRSAWSVFSASDLSARHSSMNAIDYLVPHVPLGQFRNTSVLTSAFPPLGSGGLYEQPGQINRSTAPDWQQSTTSQEAALSLETHFLHTDEPESPLIAYLILLTRSTKRLERLMAASVLTVLYRAGLTNRSRETVLGLLVVPLLVQLLDDECSETRACSAGESVQSRRLIRERAPSVLATLIVDSEYLQKTAFEAGVINKLAKMIKAAYDPVLESLESRTWSPNSGVDVDIKSICDSPTSKLGQSGYSPVLVHKIRVRESTLRAIAALVPFKDEYRKALIDQGVVPFVVESLKPNPDRPSPRSAEKPAGHVVGDDGHLSHGYGVHPVSVLIAACGAVRHLSRSVSILRTTLIDNGVVMPVFSLLQHSDIDVQIAATAAVCNLVMDFSPMRETISSAGVLKILCEHAHSGNVKLRLNALWALKHLVQSAGNDVKKTCLEELGQGWLVQLICSDTEDEAISSAKFGSGPLIVNNDHEADVQMNQLIGGDEDINMADGIGVSSQPHGTPTVRWPISGSHTVHSREGMTSMAGARLAVLREMEMNPARKARKDDIAVQEQGLDFIRNLIGGFNNVGTSETSEMIDFLFSALGQDQIFSILASKLKPKISNPFRRSLRSDGDTKVIPPQAEIIAAVEYILVHMAASVPRHRQLVIAQTDLLKLLVSQFDHPNKEVRLALCWLVINLTWVDDAHDSQACTQRALELKKLGFLSKLESLENDSELDVRERAKTALWQLRQGC